MSLKLRSLSGMDHSILLRRRFKVLAPRALILKIRVQDTATWVARCIQIEDGDFYNGITLAHKKTPTTVKSFNGALHCITCRGAHAAPATNMLPGLCFSPHQVCFISGSLSIPVSFFVTTLDRCL